jgi:hypothetical protein
MSTWIQESYCHSANEQTIHTFCREPLILWVNISMILSLSNAFWSNLTCSFGFIHHICFVLFRVKKKEGMMIMQKLIKNTLA